jgi:hypothetical protein
VKRGYIKFHVAAGMRMGKELSEEATKEYVHEDRILQPMVRQTSSRAQMGRVIRNRDTIQGPTSRICMKKGPRL